MGAPVVIESWLLLAHSWVGLTLRMAAYKAQPWPQCARCCAAATPQSGIHLSRVWCLGYIPWICCLWSLLDPALMLSEAGHWVCLFWAFCEGPQRRPVLDIACDWPWATYLALQAIQSLCCFLWAECAWKEPSCVPRQAFSRSWGRSGKVPVQPNTYLCLPPPVISLLGSVTETASSNIQIVWGRFSVSHQVEKSGVHQIDSGSNLVSVLGLRLLGRYSQIYQI